MATRARSVHIGGTNEMEAMPSVPHHHHLLDFLLVDAVWRSKTGDCRQGWLEHPVHHWREAIAVRNIGGPIPVVVVAAEHEVAIYVNATITAWPFPFLKIWFVLIEMRTSASRRSVWRLYPVIPNTLGSGSPFEQLWISDGDGLQLFSNKLLKHCDIIRTERKFNL
jgi:hypothetical protein